VVFLANMEPYVDEDPLEPLFYFYFEDSAANSYEIDPLIF